MQLLNKSFIPPFYNLPLLDKAHVYLFIKILLILNVFWYLSIEEIQAAKDQSY